MTRRGQIVRQRTRLKNTIQAILHAHLVPRCPATDLFGRKGRAWLAEQKLPPDEQRAIERHLRELERLAEDLAAIEKEIAQSALTDPRVRRLMTITGMDAVCAVGISAAIGDIQRFASPQLLVSYFSLNPSVRQSGGHPALDRQVDHPRGAVDGDVEVAFARPGADHAQLRRVLDVDVQETEVVLLEVLGALLGRGGRVNRQAPQAFGLQDAVDGVAVEVRQEMAHREGEVVEWEPGAPAQLANDGALFLGGPPAQVLGAHPLRTAF